MTHSKMMEKEVLLMATQEFSPKFRPATLIIVGKKTEDVRVVYLRSDMTMGREDDDHTVDISLRSMIVSRAHGLFSLIDGDFYYTDTHSRNGTYLNGKRIPQENGSDSKPVKLQDGDILRIDRPTLNDPHPDAVTMIYSTTYDKKSTWIKKELNPFQSVVIGRGDENGIALHQSYISSEHALISYDRNKGSYIIINCGSKNGVLLNNREVTGSAVLYDRNVIRICDTLMFVLDGMLIYNVSQMKNVGLLIDIKETNVGGAVKKKKLLQNVYLEIEKGDFVLILGGSGAGKTTLVNSVLGKYAIKGSVQVESDDGTSGKSIRDMMAYVPQTLAIRKEEKLIDVITDTVIIRNPRVKKQDRRAFVLDNLQILGLRKKAEDGVRIRSLSGGEQRRAAIANELVAEPEIFFLDEPDSGLDPATGYDLMNTLKKLSEKGKIIMLISHNYASYPHPEQIYSKVVVLAKGTNDVGELAFLGSLPEAMKFFGVENIIDITRVLNERPDEFIAKYKQYGGNAEI